ncbi:MAG: Membrane-associated protein [Syntrophomonadaceae bacterium]|nr:Membrane-associated protein [Bacillota bacterium]
MELIAAKKVIIITEALMEQQVLSLLKAQGAEAYTVIRNLTGQGVRGVRSGQCLAGFCENVRIELIVKEEAQAKALMEAVYNKFLAEKYAGIAYLEDVRILHHGKI